MKKKLFITLVSLALLVLLLRLIAFTWSQLGSSSTRAGLKVTSIPIAEVWINGQKVGETPYQDENLTAGEYDIRLASEKSNWQGIVELSKGTLSVINRDLTEGQIYSSGEVMTLKEGQGIILTSSPQQAEIEIDGQIVGKTPYSSSDLASGDHTLIFSHPNYIKRKVQVQTPSKFALVLDVDLAISQADLTSTPASVSTDQISATVKQTPTGFLRVRDKPSLQGVELGRLAPKETVVILEELSGWMKIRSSKGIEGYVSAVYIQKSS